MHKGKLTNINPPRITTEPLKTGGDNIRGQVFDRYAKSSRIMTGPLSPAEFSD